MVDSKLPIWQRFPVTMHNVFHSHPIRLGVVHRLKSTQVSRESEMFRV